MSFGERQTAGLPGPSGGANTNNSETKTTSNNQVSIPTLKPHHFYNHDQEPGKSSVDVVVVFMHGGAEDDSRYSIFVYDEKLESSDIPKSTSKEDAIKPRIVKAPNLTEDSEDNAILPTERYTSKNERSIRAEIKALGAEEALLAETRVESVKLEVLNKAQQSLLSNTASPQPKPAPPKRINWLEDKDMLPSVIPEGRILGFGFDLSTVNAPIDFDSTAASLLDSLVERREVNSTKPIIFIGHGYGSVVIESLLSRNDGKGTPSSQLRASTASVILFAAPFAGSKDLIKWSVREMKLLESPDSCFRLLGNDSGMLQKIWDDFVKHTRNLDIFISLYRENGPATDSATAEGKVAQKLVEDFKNEGGFVEQTSAEIGQIARFSGPKERDFLVLTGRILTGIQTWQLLGAAKRGDEDSLKDLMGHSIDINLVSKTKQTALHVSAHYGKLEFTRMLLGNRKLDIDHKDNLGNTALHIAVQGNRRETVKELLKAGANPDIRNRQKQKPKHLPGIEFGITNLLKKPPLVEGPPAQPQRELKVSQPPRGAGIAACKSTEMVATEMFLIEGKENHLTTYPSIHDLIYTETVVEKMLKSERSTDITQEPYCRWYHIPANNVSG